MYSIQVGEKHSHGARCRYGMCSFNDEGDIRASFVGGNDVRCVEGHHHHHHQRWNEGKPPPKSAGGKSAGNIVAFCMSAAPC